MKKICEIIIIFILIKSVICEECFDGAICDIEDFGEIQQVVDIFNSNIENIEPPFDGGCAIPPVIINLIAPVRIAKQVVNGIIYYFQAIIEDQMQGGALFNAYFQIHLDDGGSVTTRLIQEEFILTYEFDENIGERNNKDIHPLCILLPETTPFVETTTFTETTTSSSEPFFET